MPGRSIQSSKKYTFGFNGQITDTEWNGGQNVAFEFRMNDPRLGRFLSVDPLINKNLRFTPYQFAGNSPISGIDKNGLDYFYSADGTFIGKYGDGDVVRVFHESKTETAYAKYALRKILKSDLDYNEKFYSNLITYTDVLMNGDDEQMTQEEFLDRVHWAYGEGAGRAANYYAHSIENRSDRPEFGEENLFRYDKDAEGYMTAGGNSNYKRFRGFRNRGLKFSKNEDEAVKEKIMTTFKETIGAILDRTEDPTGGSIGWFGQEQFIETARRKHNTDYQEVMVIKTPMSSTGTKKAYHIFFDITTRFTKDKRDTTGKAKAIIIEKNNQGSETDRDTINAGEDYEYDNNARY